MAHYLCPECHDVVDADGPARVTRCIVCGQPLSVLDLLPIRPGAPSRGPAPMPAEANSPVPVG